MLKFLKRFLTFLLLPLLFASPSCADILEDGLHIYFLDVGQGDAAVILCDGEAMMIDGGDSKHSSFIYGKAPLQGGLWFVYHFRL